MDHDHIQRIELSRLIAHPMNANVMPPAVMKKLRRHIQRTGRYEPLVVRPHPTLADAFELINGHHRKRVLEDLGCTHADCLVWNLDDAETLLLLATINRLSGEDAPARRLELLEALAKQSAVSAAQLAQLLPESARALQALQPIAAPHPPAEAPPLADMPEAFTVFLTHADKQRLVEALRRTHPDPAVALLQWASTQ